MGRKEESGEIRGLLPSSDTVLLLSRDVTAMSFGDQSMCVSRRFCATKKILESDSVARHSSVAIKQREVYNRGRKLAFSTLKCFPMAHKLALFRLNEHASFYCCMLEMFEKYGGQSDCSIAKATINGSDQEESSSGL